MNYQNHILKDVVNPSNDTLFVRKYWVFQQDLAPTHTAKMTQR